MASMTLDSSIVSEIKTQPAIRRSTAVLLKRSVSCQDNNARRLDWSCERDLCTVVPDSNLGRQAQRNHRASNDRERRSEAARIINETSAKTITQASKYKSNSKEDDLASNTENVSTEYVENVSTVNVENVSTVNVENVSTGNVDNFSTVTVENVSMGNVENFLTANVENVSSENVENVSTANTEKNFYTENLVLITKVSRVNCRLEIPLIAKASLSPLSRAAIEPDDGYQSTEVCKYLSYDDFPELTPQERLPGVSKVRDPRRERPHRSGKKWRPIGDDVQLNFQMNLLPRSTSDRNGDAILNDCCAQSRLSVENESHMSQNEWEIFNSKSHESYLEERSEEEDEGSLKYQISPAAVDSCFCGANDGDYYHDVISLYFEKIPRYPPSSFPCEPYLPVRQQLRSGQKWKKTRAGRQVKSQLRRTIEKHRASRPHIPRSRLRDRTPKYFDPYYNILLIDEDPYESYDYRNDYEYSYEDIRWGRSSGSSDTRSRFAVDAYNADGALSADLVNVLINLQHRDLLPEDYDLLLRLDDWVAPSTVDPGVLATMKTEVVAAAVVDADVRSDDCLLLLLTCGVCMEPFETGQTAKHLPCGHCYHAACIDRWLTNSSQKCPLDGLAVNLRSVANPEECSPETCSVSVA